MYFLRNQFFTGAILTGNQHVGIGFGHFAYQVEHQLLQHDTVGADLRQHGRQFDAQLDAQALGLRPGEAGGRGDDLARIDRVEQRLTALEIVGPEIFNSPPSAACPVAMTPRR